MDHRRILILEDDPMISSHLETIVAKTVGSEVVISASVAEAMHALDTNIDFALLDVDVVDGATYGFASKLTSADIPFAFVSASDRSHVPPCHQDVPFIAKPYTDDDIVQLLQRAAKNAA